MERNKITIKETAELLGISSQMLRTMIKMGKFKEFAIVIKNKNRHYYYINRTKLYEFLGKYKEKRVD